MRRRLSRNSRAAAFLLLALASVGARAEPPPAASRALQLEVFIDDRPTGLIAAFRQSGDGRLSATRGELAEIGVRAPGRGDKDELVRLDDVEGLSYAYEERRQSVRLRLAGQARLAREYGPGGEKATPRGDLAPRGWSASMNYLVFGAASTPSLLRPRLEPHGVSATLDARLSTPLGVLSQTGIVGATTRARVNALRLDTSWSWSDPVSLTTLRAGDSISSGLAWTRPVRFGGLQAQSNFALRPDLVTLPLPSLEGTAAVPSTLDVYVGATRAYSARVEEGPWRLSDLPLLGAGSARVVLRDSTGREVEQETPFFSTPLLLRPGLMDWSAEIGFARRSYGALSDDYARKPMVSASLRRGVASWLTLSAHVEGAPRLALVGAGATLRLFDRGALDVAGSFSRAGADRGAQLYAAFETRLAGVTLSLSSQRTFGTYTDLAAVTAAPTARAPGLGVANGGVDPLLRTLTVAPPRAVDRIAASFPLPFDASHLSLALTRIDAPERGRTLLASAGWTRRGPFGGALFLNGFVNLARSDATRSSAGSTGRWFGGREGGVFAGLAMPLWDGGHVSVQGGARGGEATVSLDASKSLTHEPGAWGWRVRDVETRGGVPQREAALAWRSQWARVQASAGQQGAGARGSLEIEGAVAAAGGGVFLANRIGDAFAVVKTGAPGVEVRHENRLVGRADSRGRLLAPDLRAWEKNAIEIDPASLPVDAEAARTRQTVTPRAGAGVVVDFGVRTDIRAAIVELVDATGKPIAAGLEARREDGGASATVGYDGRVYLTDLKADNALRVARGAGDCVARFAYRPDGSPQQRIGPVICK